MSSVSPKKTRRGREMRALVIVSALAIAPAKCGSKKPPESEPPPPVSVTSATGTVPPIAPESSTGTPVSAFADAAAPEGRTPLDQARAYEANGQLWLARLVLEKKALSSDGTKQEAELLAWICHQQSDEACVDNCAHKLGHKLKFDGGAPKHNADAGDHKEADDLSKAKAHFAKNEVKEARAILEPKVVDGKASKDEIRLLKSVCQKQSDRMCVALCDAKLK